LQNTSSGFATLTEGTPEERVTQRKHIWVHKEEIEGLFVPGLVTKGIKYS
jgi:hypothetical protein